MDGMAWNDMVYGGGCGMAWQSMEWYGIVRYHYGMI